MTSTALVPEHIAQEQPIRVATTGSRDDHQPRTQDAASVEALAWLAQRLHWERRIQELHRER